MWLLNLINPFNKLVDFANAFFNKRMDVDLEKYKVKGNIDVKAIEADVAIIQARASLATAMKDDPGTKVARLGVLVPASVYFGVAFYYFTFANLLPKSVIWQPLPLPPSFDYLIYGIIGYLFVTAWRGR